MTNHAGSREVLSEKKSADSILGSADHGEQVFDIRNFAQLSEEMFDEW